MTGTDLIVDVVCIGLILGMLAIARWQGLDDRRRQQRLQDRRSWKLIERCEQYGYHNQDVDAFIDEVLEEAA